MAGVCGSEAEMMGYDCFDELAISVQVGEISDLLISVSQLMEDI